MGIEIQRICCNKFRKRLNVSGKETACKILISIMPKTGGMRFSQSAAIRMHLAYKTNHALATVL